MAEQPVNPVTPVNIQREAAAASTAAVFTAADRKIIEERTGGAEMRSRGFLDALKDKPLLPEVENQETTVQEPQKDAEATVSRFDQHRRMLKHSPITLRKDRVILSGKLPDEYQEETPLVDIPHPLTPSLPACPSGRRAGQAGPSGRGGIEIINNLISPLPLGEGSADITKPGVRDIPSELFDKFNLEQQELFSLISRLRELHLKRLLSESRLEFEQLSSEIKKTSLSAAKPAEKEWLEDQFNRLTLEAANYKLGVMRSLQQIEFNVNRENDIRWLEDEVKKLQT
ncbi:MAG: hypothetical protein QME05_03890 [Candidatus Margulisbacteria bacterium]|nr:hypothetical protein [Candidatus Margulisiibacteriota bacterium]